MKKQKTMKQPLSPGKGEKIFIDYVSQDKDWRGVIDNELKCQEGWHKVWGFLADNTVSENPLTKEEKINILEEKLKSMSDVKINSVMKQSYVGGDFDFKVTENNRTKDQDLMPQSRRPKNISKAYAYLEAAGLVPELKKK